MPYLPIRLSAAAAGVCLATAPLVARPQTRPLQDPTHETQTADVPGLTAATSTCNISDDPTFGVSQENPVKVGGGAMYLASREVKYMSALRGPDGQGLHFKRVGSLKGPDGTILDGYTVTYQGLDKPVEIFIDGYHWAQPVAPKGWLCGADMNLVPPGPDPFETQDQLMALAVALGDKPVAPISIDPDGSSVHGVVFDHVRLVGLAARAAAAAGTPLQPRALGEWGRPRTVVIAYPRQCDGQTASPESVTLSDASGNSPHSSATARGEDIARFAPGFTVPPGAVAIVYDAQGLIEGARIGVRFASACGAEPAEVILPVKSERGRVVKSVLGVAPADVTIPPGGAQVRVQVFLDADGTPRYPAYVAGPYELRDAALAAAADWRVEPPTMNGAPLLQTATLAITFRPK
ncbi:MAG TPA: hypothetical protein VLT86_16820 [Vicinamibacterales bacterium]|nr:hypothetical protein [Vicinamibacterales bacterium]